MKKVGMMTWFRYVNYGTALQASALFTKIKELGYEPKLIDYTPKGTVVENYKITSKMLREKVINKVKKIDYSLYNSQNKKTLFEEFLKNSVDITNKVNTYPELNSLNSEFDAFVCGSDQIWSPNCFDDKYFLSFVDDSEKMIAYAPSMGTTKISNKDIEKEIQKLVSRFRYLSVREQQGVKLVENICDKKAELVLDPTLLLNKSEWEEALRSQGSQNNKIISGNYIVCYFLGDYRKYDSIVREISTKLDMPIYVIPVFKKQENKVPFDVGPYEFVNLIKNAKYVCTDSFHGIAFSINFNVPFTAFKRFKDNNPKNQNSRIYNILNVTQLQDRLINNNNVESLECDFSKANESLEKLRKHSVYYLDNALKSATQSDNSTKVKNCNFKIADLCCGCGVCSAVCNQSAISIEKNSNGFEHYVVDENKCIKCNRCKQVCPFVKITAKDLKQAKSLYSYKSFSKDVLKKSSSGGIAFELGQIYNKKGYWICGSSYLKEIDSAKHIIIPPLSEEQLPQLQGSKYIQSISANAMRNINSFDKEEKLIFFGTPCQVAGLDKLLRNKKIRDNFILVDLICHGVPSQLLWSKYIEGIRKKYKISEHPEVVFRSKKSQWHLRYIKIKDSSNCYEKSEIKDDFYAIFRRGLLYMDTCFECPYREKSAADIRIGDYWGERFSEDKQGVSMVIANTIKGEKIINELIGENIGDIKIQPMQEYWTVQYPYNKLKPVFNNKMISDLKNPEYTISQIRKEYCSLYDFNEYIGKKKITLKKVLGKVMK